MQPPKLVKVLGIEQLFLTVECDFMLIRLKGSRCLVEKGVRQGRLINPSIYCDLTENKEIVVIVVISR